MLMAMMMILRRPTMVMLLMAMAIMLRSWSRDDGRDFEDEGDDLDQLHYENKVRHNLKVLNGSKENANLQEEAKVLIPRQKAQFEKGYTQKWDDKVLQ
jgi:hypothetical protein